MSDCLDDWRQRIVQAAADAAPLRIVGGGSKDFYGRPAPGEPLLTAEHRGIVNYEPSELSVTARCGTPLAELEAVLAEAGQMLAFEPPHFAGGATLGGAIAAGLSGPRRAAAGAARDFVLGASILDGRGAKLSFGGQVMKNVAGYDVSRLLVGSLGTLGLLLEVSLKVLPRPAATTSLGLAANQAQALALCNRYAGRPLPISASAWQDHGDGDGGRLTLRLSGSGAAVAAAQREIGGEVLDDTAAANFWRDLRDQRSDFFAGTAPLWRLSLASTTPPLALPGATLIEWGGSLRWLRSEVPAATLHAAMAALGDGAHATLFRGPDASRRQGVFQPLPAALLALQRRIKQRFDPAAIFNRGRLYAEL